MITVDLDTSHLAKALVDYQHLSGKTMADVVRKQGRKLGYTLGFVLRNIAPKKGTIRSERLAAMAEGVGLYIRDLTRRRVRAKKNRQQALVKRELGIRESARGFLWYATSFTKEIETRYVKRGRRQRALGLGVFTGGTKVDSNLTFSWGPNVSRVSGMVAEGLDQDEARKLMQTAVDSVTADIKVYTDRKLQEAFNRRRA